MKDQQISSGWTIPLIVIMFVFWVVMLPLLIYITGMDFKLEGSQLFAFIFYLLLVALTTYLTVSLSVVKLSGNEIICKKFFRPEKRFTFDKIGYPKTFRYKRLKFTSVEMHNDDGTKCKYLILNNKALLSGERKDAEKILLTIRKTGGF
jgi:hypothetical protein